MSGDRPLLLFDVDGVLLQEVGYYRTLAITCAHFYEQICEAMGIPPSLPLRADATSMADVERLREAFLPASLLRLLRSRALNSNWDKTYAIVLAMRVLSPEVLTSDSLQTSIFAVLSDTSGSGNRYLRQLEHMVNVSDHKLFEQVYEVFQQVHLGPWPTVPFLHRGMIEFDEPMVEKNELLKTFQNLQNQSFLMGIGTGRPWKEVKMPLEALGLLRFFQPDRIVTIDEVRKAEDREGLAPFSLAKPHPYTYIRGANEYSPDDVYVIGDSLSDQLAANDAGFHFIGIGHASAFSDARTNPHAVIDHVLHLPSVLVNNGG